MSSIATNVILLFVLRILREKNPFVNKVEIMVQMKNWLNQLPPKNIMLKLYLNHNFHIVLVLQIFRVDNRWSGRVRVSQSDSSFTLRMQKCWNKTTACLTKQLLIRFVQVQDAPNSTGEKEKHNNNNISLISRGRSKQTTGPQLLKMSKFWNVVTIFGIIMRDTFK